MTHQISNNLDPQHDLTALDKRHISNYLWKIFVPITTIFAIASGLIGYFIKDIATEKAINAGIAVAYSHALQTAEQALNAKQTAQESVKAMERLMQDSVKIANMAEQTRQQLQNLEHQLKTAEAFKNSNDIVDRIAAALVTDPRISMQLEESIISLLPQIKSIEKDLKTLKAASRSDSLLLKCQKDGSCTSKAQFDFPVSNAVVVPLNSLPENISFSFEINNNAVIVHQKKPYLTEKNKLTKSTQFSGSTSYLVYATSTGSTPSQTTGPVD